jgi:hypothetical protein
MTRMMPNTLSFRTAVLGAALTLVTVPAAAQIVADGSFETPQIGGFAYRPTGAAWTFTGNSGLINGTSNGFGVPSNAPDANQVAFLQTDYTTGGFGRISQSITFSSSGAYRLTFYDGGRTTVGGTTFFDVLLNATVLGTRTTTTGQAYALQTVDFTANAGTYDLAFAFNAQQPLGDNTALVDDVQIVSLAPASTVPEPSTWAMMGTGLLGLGGMTARRRRASV